MGTALHRPGRNSPSNLRDQNRSKRRDLAGLRQESPENTNAGTDVGPKTIEKPRLTPWRELRVKLLQNPDVREAHENTPLEFTLMLEISAARARSGLTQAEIAARMGTTQSAVARLESERLPSLRTLKRYAEAVGAKLVVKLDKHQ